MYSHTPDDTDEVCSAVSPDTRRRYVASESLGWIAQIGQQRAETLRNYEDTSF